MIINKLKFIMFIIKTNFYYKFIFKNIGNKSIIHSPMKIVNGNKISIGNHSVIEKEATLYCVNQYGGKQYKGKIKIGSRCYINHHLNITSASNVEIEDDVLIAYNVSMFDFDHNYYDISKNINGTDLLVKGNILIGEKSWIGMNVSIVGNITIGKHCIIGANSLVNRSIPDYSMAVGNPIKVIKKYNFENEKWERAEEL